MCVCVYKVFFSPQSIRSVLASSQQVTSPRAIVRCFPCTFFPSIFIFCHKWYSQQRLQKFSDISFLYIMSAFSVTWFFLLAILQLQNSFWKSPCSLSPHNFYLEINFDEHHRNVDWVFFFSFLNVFN